MIPVGKPGEKKRWIHDPDSKFSFFQNHVVEKNGGPWRNKKIKDKKEKGIKKRRKKRKTPTISVAKSNRIKSAIMYKCCGGREKQQRRK